MREPGFDGRGRSPRNDADELKRTDAETAPPPSLEAPIEGTFRFEKPVFCNDDTTGRIIRAFYHVYREMGEGHLESVYKNAMAITLRNHGMSVEIEAPILATFENQPVGRFRADLLINRQIVVELKAAKSLDPAHVKQLINYLKSSGLSIGFVFNFGTRPDFVRRVFTHRKPA
ncbi:MAG: uncharacterized protein JWO05_3270 [Gemmatimonadetes bacterium]|nr:uncharacterized protein [Gemmatimonadota bacterium]